jgi:hypothetical protein
LGGGHINSPSLEDERAADDDVVLVDAVGRVLAHVVEQVAEVAAVELARLGGHAAGEVGVADDGDAGVDDRLAGAGELAVAAGLGGEVDDHAAGLHRLEHVALEQRGAGRPGISAVVMMMSTSLACSRKSSISASMNSWLITLA